MRILHYLACTLVIIGALNWGLVGLFQLDLVAALFGAGSAAARTVYVLVGVSAIVLLFTSAAMRRRVDPARPGGLR